MRSGGDGKVDTPVPIPNTEVKHFSGDNSYACRSEDNTLPGQTHSVSLFFVYKFSTYVENSVETAYIKSFYI